MAAANSMNSVGPDARLQDFLQKKFSGPNTALVNPKFQMNTDTNFNQRSVSQKNQLSVSRSEAPSWTFKQPRQINYRDVNVPPAGVRSTGSSAYQFDTSVRNKPMATTRLNRQAW
jgi:hypothetical protein